MTLTATGEKRFLNYQGATFKRSLIYLGLACLLISACVFIKFPTPILSPGEVAGPPFPKIILGFIAVCMILNAITDAIFVLYQNYLRRNQFAFDQENFYIIRKDGTEQIPLKNIFQIAMVYTNRRFGARGYCNRYRINYVEEGQQKDFIMTIYYRMRNNFEDFKKIVSVKNPSVEIKTWATSLDWIARLIKKRKPGNA
jgi:hypothetical protein